MSIDPEDDAYVYTTDDDEGLPVDEFIQRSLHKRIGAKDKHILDAALQEYKDEQQRIAEQQALEKYIQEQYQRLLRSVAARFYDEYHVDDRILQEAEEYRYTKPYNWYNDHRYH